MNTNIFPESFVIFGSITMSIWYKIRFSLLIPQKSENFDILSRFNLHMHNINFAGNNSLKLILQTKLFMLREYIIGTTDLIGTVWIFLK